MKKLASPHALVFGLFLAYFTAVFFAPAARAKTTTIFDPPPTSHSEKILTDDNSFLYYGGPVVPHIKVIVVFWGNQVDPVTVANIGPFYSALTDSDYLDWLQEYDTNVHSESGAVGTNQSIGRGSFGGAYTITPANSAKALGTADIESELLVQLNRGVLPAPTTSTVYDFYFPAGIKITADGNESCSAWCGQHDALASEAYGNVLYGMFPDLSGSCSFGCGFAANAWDSLTTISSHELAETITDPLGPLVKSGVGYPAAWIGNLAEIGDYCQGTFGELTQGSHTYTVQSEWDKNANDCRGGHYLSSFANAFTSPD